MNRIDRLTSIIIFMQGRKQVTANGLAERYGIRVMFSREEASSLLAGERLMQKWRETDLGKPYLSALEKNPGHSSSP